MKNKSLCQQLREAGNRVHVTHYRDYFALEKGRPVVVSHARHELPHKEDVQYALPKGGFTEVKITTRNGSEFTAVAECSPHDNYCRKVGVKTALERLLKTMALKQLVDE